MLDRHWQKYLLQEIVKLIFSGGTPSTQKKEYWNGKYSWLSSGETRNDFINKTEKTITQEGINESTTKLAEQNDIVIASAGQGNTRGQVSLCMINTYINQSLIAIRARDTLVNPTFLFYNLKNRYRELRKISDDHSIRGSLTTKMIGRLVVLLPSLPEQTAISNIILDLDKKIQLNTKINQNFHVKLLHKIINFIMKCWHKSKFRSHGSSNIQTLVC